MTSYWQPAVAIRPEDAAANAAQIALSVNEEEARRALVRASGVGRAVFDVTEAIAYTALVMARAEATRCDYWDIAGLDWAEACHRAAHLINHGVCPTTMRQLFETA